MSQEFQDFISVIDANRRTSISEKSVLVGIPASSSSSSGSSSSQPGSVLQGSGVLVTAGGQQGVANSGTVASTTNSTAITLINSIVGEALVNLNEADKLAGENTPRPPDATVIVGASNFPGAVFVKNDEGKNALTLNAVSALIDAGVNGQAGNLFVRDDRGRPGLRLFGNSGQLDVGSFGQNGLIRVQNARGDVGVELDGTTGDVRLMGADCAEEFTIAEGEGDIEPGTVMSIDEEGLLRRSMAAYDRCVAGVVSGAGSFKPGIILGRNPAQKGGLPIALIGRVFCKVDANQSPIRVGDLLTTANEPGFAMKANDPARAFGAVIGKALRSLSSGQCLIPVLVALQ